MRILTRNPILGVVTIACGLALAASPGVAQQAQRQPQEQQSPQAQQETRVDDMTREELETVAAAFLDVNDLQSEYQARLGQAATQEEAQAIQQEANEEILAVLDDHGVSVEDYSAVVNATQENTAFRERFTQALDRVQQETEQETAADEDVR